MFWEHHLDANGWTDIALLKWADFKAELIYFGCFIFFRVRSANSLRIISNNHNREYTGIAQDCL